MTLVGYERPTKQESFKNTNSNTRSHGGHHGHGGHGGGGRQRGRYSRRHCRQCGHSRHSRGSCGPRGSRHLQELRPQRCDGSQQVRKVRQGWQVRQERGGEEAGQPHQHQHQHPLSSRLGRETNRISALLSIIKCPDSPCSSWQEVQLCTERRRIGRGYL